MVQACPTPFSTTTLSPPPPNHHQHHHTLKPHLQLHQTINIKTSNHPNQHQHPNSINQLEKSFYKNQTLKTSKAFLKNDWKCPDSFLKKLLEVSCFLFKIKTGSFLVSFFKCWKCSLSFWINCWNVSLRCSWACVGLRVRILCFLFSSPLSFSSVEGLAFMRACTHKSKPGTLLLFKPFSFIYFLFLFSVAFFFFVFSFLFPLFLLFSFRSSFSFLSCPGTKDAPSFTTQRTHH